jgi:signal transduction histidine kinase
MPAFRPGLWPAACALALGIEWLGYGGGVGLAAADLAVGLTFLACGLLVWRPERRDPVPFLFLATGLAWLLGTLAGSDVGILSAVGSALLYAHRGPFVHLVLAYPSGRLRSPVDRVVVAAAYLNGLVVALARNDAVTVALVGAVIAAAVVDAGACPAEVRRARALATASAALVGAVLALGSIGRLVGAHTLSDTTLVLVYEAALLIAALSLTIGIVFDRSRSAAVADLVVELGTGSRSETLRGALAQAFGDPLLELGYRVGDSYVDDEGRPMRLPHDDAERAVTLVERDCEPVAALVHDAAVARDPGLAEAVAAAIRLAASHARLQAELHNQVGELRVSRRRMIEAGDAQRSRLERRLSQAAELHLQEMRLALDRGLETAAPEVAAALAVVQRELDEAVVELHELARGIHPRTLAERGLGPALTELAATAPTPVSVGAPDDRFPPIVEVAAYFVCAEALANVAKYAHAGHASVEVQCSDGRLRVVISDDGVGGADPNRGSGLRGLADRVDAVGGRLTVTSPVSGGTSVLAEIPLEQFA